MKKFYKILMVGFILFALMVSIKHQVKAETVPSWEFFPIGDNYLDPDNFYVYGEYPNWTISSYYHFKIKPNHEYTLFSTFCQEIAFADDYAFSFYDQNKIELDVSVTYTEGYDSYYINMISFVTPSDAYYINIAFDAFAYQQFYGEMCVDEFFVFCEGNVYPDPWYSILYLGPDTNNLSPIISGANGYYFSDVDNPVSVETIQSYLQAIDDVDGDITDQIVILDDDYTPNKTIIGEYEVIFQVTDSALNTSSFCVIVEVFDKTPPVIQGSDFHQIKETVLKPISYFQGFLIASDNYDQDITSQINVFSENYTDNYHIQGIYEIIYEVIDSSDNRTEFVVTVEVIDGIPPVFYGPETITKPNNVTMTLYAIVSEFTAVDNNDGEVTNLIIIENDHYSKYQNKVGTWYIEISCCDSTGNISYHTIYIHVLDETKPIFLYDTRTITIDLSENRLEVFDMIKVLIKTNAISEEAIVEVLTDDYTDNKNTPGTYKIVLGVDEAEFEIEVRVIEGLYEQLQDNGKVSFLQQILNFFIKIFQIVKDFFKRLFVKIFA